MCGVYEALLCLMSGSILSSVALIAAKFVSLFRLDLHLHARDDPPCMILHEKCIIHVSFHAVTPLEVESLVCN